MSMDMCSCQAGKRGEGKAENNLKLQVDICKEMGYDYNITQMKTRRGAGRMSG